MTKYSDPYLSGLALGLVLLGAFVFAGRGLGALPSLFHLPPGVVVFAVVVVALAGFAAAERIERRA